MLRKQIKEILQNQSFAVLSTFNSDYQQPYASIIAFDFSDDLSALFFATPKATRKYNNLKTCPNVALLIDNRKNDGTDIGDAAAITAIGSCDDVDDPERRQCFVQKHPQLKEFIKSPSTAFFRVNIKKYILVNRFQDVSELRVR